MTRFYFKSDVEDFSEDANTFECEDNTDDVIKIVKLKLQTDYHGVAIIKEFLFTFICNIVIRCLHNKMLSVKEISEIYVTVLLSFYYDEYLVIREISKNAGTSDPLFSINDNACVTESMTEMIQTINETIGEYPCYIYMKHQI